MTSAITRDDIEAMLHTAGVRPPAVIDRILRAVDTYAYSRPRLPLADSFEPYGYLSPGESDLAVGVTRCRECKMPKRTDTQFHACKTSPSGFTDTCKACAGPRKPPPPPPDLNLWLRCKQCGEEKRAEGNYYRRGDTRSGYGVRCKNCLDGVKECASCGSRRPAGDFRPRTSAVCAVCES